MDKIFQRYSLLSNGIFHLALLLGGLETPCRRLKHSHFSSSFPILKENFLSLNPYESILISKHTWSEMTWIDFVNVLNFQTNDKWNKKWRQGSRYLKYYPWWKRSFNTIFYWPLVCSSNTTQMNETFSFFILIPHLKRKISRPLSPIWIIFNFKTDLIWNNMNWFCQHLQLSN